MKNLLLTLGCLLASVAYSQAGELLKEHGSYEMLRIKARAASGFTNHGTVIYEYVGDEDLRKYAPNDIGNVRLQRFDVAREVYVGIDINQPLELGADVFKTLEVGNVESHQRNSNLLRKVDINVDLRHKVNF